jgi:FkbM family methyltransferase
MRAIFSWKQEQTLVREFLGDSRTRFFVDVGAADPQLGSQTWHLEAAGWSGVLIEPRPDMAERLRRERHAKVYEFACASPAKASRSMPLHLRGGYSSLGENLMIAGLDPQGMVSVALRTLDDILVDAKAPSPVDFVSIDVEGFEIEVLEGFDLDRWRPRLILIEDHAQNLSLHRALSQRGYKWVRRTGLNAWYVPADHPMTVGWVGKLQFLRKYYLSLPTRRVRDAVRRARAFTGVLPPSRGR